LARLKFLLLVINCMGGLVYSECYCGLLNVIDFQEVPYEPFVPLTDDEEHEVSRAFSSNRYNLMLWLNCY
jgi:hypothetical protein